MKCSICKQEGYTDASEPDTITHVQLVDDILSAANWKHTKAFKTIADLDTFIADNF